MSGIQGWETATFRCGRCDFRFDSTTEAHYLENYARHQAAHQLVDTMSVDLFKQMLEMTADLSVIFGRLSCGLET